MTNLSVATSESWTDKNTGQKQERTEWHRVSLFGKGFIVQLLCIRVQILTDFSDSSTRYSTIEKKEAAHIGYNRFLFTHSLLAVILCLCF
jgi:hypothetical protein